MRNILVIGATSAIAQQTCRHFANNNDRFFILGRNLQHLEEVANDLRVRGAKQVDLFSADLSVSSQHSQLLQLALQKLEKIDVALIAYGALPNQKTCESSFEAAQNTIETNFTSVVSWLTHLANYFEKVEMGTIAVLSSVAGERGRKSNYVYGASKAALNTFLSGLRNRLHNSRVSVITIKLGFVDTPMTAHIHKGFLFTTSEKAGAAAFQAIINRRSIVYIPWFWRPIMGIIRNIPENIFKRTSL